MSFVCFGFASIIGAGAAEAGGAGRRRRVTSPIEVGWKNSRPAAESSTFGTQPCPVRRIEDMLAMELLKTQLMVEL